ncbi:hypothetical protein CMV_026995 [Castanea mollissima]|uniref:Zinc finger Sec23/Sec24-type domain-containing protein n=1 Tax=Castanea mollissima TaxID=60419 RepID=A0A8J4QB15_9ROSI|nr:hypothetical protein CMV_026995 [Castanea mollissima]
MWRSTVRSATVVSANVRSSSTRRPLHLIYQHLHYTPLYIAPFVSREKYKKEKKAQGMAVRATVARFPIDPGAQDGSGLPWGVTVTPFAEKDENGQGPEYGSEGDLLPRCENCWGYFNTYCELEQWSWTCSLCGTLNGLSSKAIARYSRPDSCPEMMSSFVDLELPGESLTHSLPPSLAH